MGWVKEEIFVVAAVCIYIHIIVLRCGGGRNTQNIKYQHRITIGIHRSHLRIMCCAGHHSDFYISRQGCGCGASLENM